MARIRRPGLGLPKGWRTSVRSAVLNVISLARYSVISAQGWASDYRRSAVELERHRIEIWQLREEVRIKDARMGHLPPHRRPHYPPAERMAILELRAARGWSLAQTARTFLVTPATISSWMRRIDDAGPYALVELREPVNKFPDFVVYLVQRLRTLCPTMGKVKIAQILARAGLHLGATTVRRMLKRAPILPSTGLKRCRCTPKILAKRPNEVWHIDLSVVPTSSGFWTPWLPFSFPQRWPFCWWIAVIVDHFSRRAMGVTAFRKQPTSSEVQDFLRRTFRSADARPCHLICDKGRQFWAADFKAFCKNRHIAVRFGAVGKHGSLAVVERFILSLKQHLRHWPVVPLKQRSFEQALREFGEWYNEFRPHTSLNGRTANEVYERRFPDNRRPRFEPRRHWPRGSPCAKPWALTRSGPGRRLSLVVEFQDGRRDLPIVSVKLAA